MKNSQGEGLARPGTLADAGAAPDGTRFGAAG
jgi:hypothetical protein